MKVVIDDIRIPVEKDLTGAFEIYISDRLGLKINEIRIEAILRKSLDARKKSQFYFNYSFLVDLPEGCELKGKIKPYDHFVNLPAGNIRKFSDPPVIVGFGPAGIFAAFTFIEYGIKPLILERGKSIEAREEDLKTFLDERKLNTESNIQFGEGGAGAYSDGKLTSRSKERPRIKNILSAFIKFGAPEEIAYLNKPHLGTDKLLKIIPAIREYLTENGARILFNAKVTDIELSGNKVKGVIVNSRDKYSSENIILATGHSARDTYSMLLSKGVNLEPKAFAMGTRIEHPVSIINEMQYGKKYMDDPALGAADYMFTFNDKKSSRGIFSFCMCPGGEVINASSENDMLLVNGMSYSARASKFSNSAVVVTVRPEDFPGRSPLAGIDLQRNIEKASFLSGGGNWSSPAQNLYDFLKDKISSGTNKNSYKMGTTPVMLKDLMPGFISDQIKKAFKDWGRRYPLFVSEKAVLIGTETRTSAPVRIVRDPVSFESTSIKGLYPAGEGSGYSGGIISSAIDGMKTAEKILGLGGNGEKNNV